MVVDGVLSPKMIRCRLRVHQPMLPCQPLTVGAVVPAKMLSYRRQYGNDWRSLSLVLVHLPLMAVVPQRGGA